MVLDVYACLLVIAKIAHHGIGIVQHINDLAELKYTLGITVFEIWTQTAWKQLEHLYYFLGLVGFVAKNYQ